MPHIVMCLVNQINSVIGYNYFHLLFCKIRSGGAKRQMQKRTFCIVCYECHNPFDVLSIEEVLVCPWKCPPLAWYCTTMLDRCSACLAHHNMLIEHEQAKNM